MKHCGSVIMPPFLIVCVKGLLLSMYNKVMTSDLSDQVFMNKKLQDESLLSSGDSSCKFLRSRPLIPLSVPGSLIFLNPGC